MLDTAIVHLGSYISKKKEKTKEACVKCERLLSGSNKITNALLSAHDGGIFSVCVMKDGTLLTGGKDRRIVAWNADYTPKNIEHQVSRERGSVDCSESDLCLFDLV